MKNGQKYLNELLFRNINEYNILVPNIYIHIGSGDHHYKNHVIPFMNYIERYNKKNIEVEVIDYIGHDSLRKYFPRFLCEKLSNILGYQLKEFNPIKLIDIKTSNNKIYVRVDVVTDKNDYEFAYYLYKENEIVEKKYYVASNNNIEFDNYGFGTYKVKVFVKSDERKHMQMSEAILLENNIEV